MRLQLTFEYCLKDDCQRNVSGSQNRLRLERRLALQQQVEFVLRVAHGELLRGQPLEHRADARLEVVEYERLVAGGKVARQNFDDGRSRVIGAVYVGAVDDDGRRAPNRVLGDQVPDVVDRREDYAAVRRQHEVVHAATALKNNKLSVVRAWREELLTGQQEKMSIFD